MPPSSPTAGATLQEEVLDARRLAREGQAETALQRLRSLIERYPEQAPALHAELAGLYLASGRADEALASVDGALIAAPTDDALLLLRGQVLERSNRAEEAARHYEGMIDANPNGIEARVRLAEVHLAAGDFVQAASLYRKCSQMAPMLGPIHRRLALIEKRLGRLEEAMEAARQASTLLQNDLETHRLYQDIATALGRREALLQEYQDLVGENPENGMFHYLYGRIIQDPEAARAEFFVASQKDPRAFWPHFALGIQDYLHGQYATATEHMKDALGCSSPDAYRAELYLSLIEMAQAHYSEAIDQVRAILRQTPSNLQAFSVLHQALLEQGDYEEAERLCDEIARVLPPGSTFPTVYRTETAVHAGQADRLRQLAEQLQAQGSLVPSDREVLAFRLAQAAMEEGDYEAAREVLEAASANAGLAKPKSLFWLGWLQMQTGHEKAARQTWAGLAKIRDRQTTETELLNTDAARYFLGDIGPAEFESGLGYLPYSEHNDYWAIRGLKAWADDNPTQAKQDFERCLEESRGNDFPARQVRIWLKELE